MTIEELLADAETAVRADVTAAIKAHPQYDAVIQAIAQKGLEAVSALVAGA